MKVFKFGGASVNSAEAVRNMAHIVQMHLAEDPLVVVVSAMGKTTNLLEKLVPGSATAAGDERAAWYKQLEDYHIGIVKSLVPNDEAIIDKVRKLLNELDETIASLQPLAELYNYNYDQVVSYGELISTTIVAYYLNHHGISTQWLDSRQHVVTDNHYREGRVDWAETADRWTAAKERWTAADGRVQVVVTQGFIAGAKEGGSDSQFSIFGEQSSTTTLGREGSDYSAAIVAYCLGAESVTIWKDVPGFLNADPKYFPDTVKIEQIPYDEAIELAYYGASVIHPKTVKPLQNMGIPLYIRSFITPESKGSVIGNFHTISPETPLYIFRNNQILLSIYPRDYSFIAEDNLQVIFGLLNELGIRVNLMQNSALSFSICVDNNEQLVGRLIERLKRMFLVRYNENLQLVTIRYYTQPVIDRIVAGRPVLLEQRSRLTEQLVVPC